MCYVRRPAVETTHCGTHVAYFFIGKPCSYLKPGATKVIKNIIYSPATAAVLKSLDAGMLRARVIANNVANVTTPGYKRVEVSFEKELRNALDKTRLRGMKTDTKHLDIGRPDILKIKPRAYKPNDPTLPSGVNNVDIDKEMAALAENQLNYSMQLKFLAGRYNKLNSAVQGRSLR